MHNVDNETGINKNHNIDILISKRKSKETNKKENVHRINPA